jgi:hypothetical protein
MPVGFLDLPRPIYTVQIAIGTSWFIWAAVAWTWQRYWVLRLFRSCWWRRAKAKQGEFRTNEKLARAIMRSERCRKITAASGLILVAMGILGLLS